MTSLYQTGAFPRKLLQNAAARLLFADAICTTGLDKRKTDAIINHDAVQKSAKKDINSNRLNIVHVRRPHMRAYEHKKAQFIRIAPSLNKNKAISIRKSSIGIGKTKMAAIIQKLKYSLRLVVQDDALSRRKHGFKPRRECQSSPLIFHIDIFDKNICRHRSLKETLIFTSARSKSRIAKCHNSQSICMRLR